jgi:6-phosphogluconolactonase
MIATLFASVAACVVGSSPGSSGKEALHVLECDTETGGARIVQTVKGIEGTTYFQLSRDGRTLWSAVGERAPDGTPRTWAVSFALEGRRLGAMAKRARLTGGTPCHVALAPDGLPAYAAYSSGVYSALVPPRGAGDASPRVYQARLPDDAVGPCADRQRKAYAHQILFTPDGRLMGVMDLGCDRVNFYRRPSVGADGENALHACVVSLKADPGDGPRHGIFTPDGKYLFVLNELSSSVTGYAYDGDVTFRRLGKWSLLPAGTDRRTTKAAAIKLTADGKVLMASNRGFDSIAFFTVGGDGKLTFRNCAKLTGSFPRDFELMPGEKFMVVGHKRSNEIQVYAFDRRAFTLTPVGPAVSCYRPLCFKFLP